LNGRAFDMVDHSFDHVRDGLDKPDHLSLAEVGKNNSLPGACAVEDWH
jgi:hypothetical protein